MRNDPLGSSRLTNPSGSARQYPCVLLIGNIIGIERSQTFQAAISRSRRSGKVSWSNLRHNSKRRVPVGRRWSMGEMVIAEFRDRGVRDRRIKALGHRSRSAPRFVDERHSRTIARRPSSKIPSLWLTWVQKRGCSKGRQGKSSCAGCWIRYEVPTVESRASTYHLT